MPYQVPKADHPWRRYVDKKGKTGVVETEHKKPVGTLLQEFGESWSTIEITTTTGAKRYLTELNQNQQAVWMIDFLRRNYVRQ